ncbi:hypothetical protein GEV49_38630 (plasmid) [Streptomyces sp. SYP-A7193]|nr:hypothetical protein GEV49_38630 [Streptomyces sp. SYP-A7193]
MRTAASTGSSVTAGVPMAGACPAEAPLPVQALAVLRVGVGLGPGEQADADGAGPAQVAERLVARGMELVVCGPWEEDPLLLAPGRPRRRPGAGRIEGPHDEERAPWLSEADSLLRRCGPRDTPTLGICLGMELLTVACGGKRHSETPEVGLCELTPLLPASRDELFALLADLDEPVRAVQWHWEETEILPDGAVPLLTSARCAHPAYRMGTSVWGRPVPPRGAGRRHRGPRRFRRRTASGPGPGPVLGGRPRGVRGGAAARAMGSLRRTVGRHRGVTPSPRVPSMSRADPVGEDRWVRTSRPPGQSRASRTGGRARRAQGRRAISTRTAAIRTQAPMPSSHTASVKRPAPRRAAAVSSMAHRSRRRPRSLRGRTGMALLDGSGAGRAARAGLAGRGHLRGDSLHGPERAALTAC